MYKKRTRTTQENTGNSKKRRLKYELYDSRFHKSYNNIKIGDYNDYSMNMNGGSNKNVPLSISSNNPNKKVIFYDDKGEVDKFIEKWFEDANNFKNMNGNNIIDVSKITSKFKSTFDVNDNDDNDDNYNKLLAQLFNKFNNHIFINSNIEPIIDNTIFTNDYITTILTQLNNETDNTVAVFEYDLYLYNLDTILKKYKTNAKFTTFFGNNDEDNYFNKHILNAKNLFGVNAIIENVRNDEDVDSDSGKKMKMYIPKLLTKAKNRIDALKGGANIDLRPTLDPYDITKLKKLENSNKTKSNNPADQEIRRITDEALWNTVLNDKKKHYGFEGETPKNLIKKKNETNKDEEFTLSNDKEIIEHYFRKCNDLQQLYINKHIELLDIFKKMNEYINLNDTINDIIKKLVDPKYFNAKGKDGKLKLPNPVITELKNLLKTQSMVKKVVGEEGEEGEEEREGEEEGGEQEREQEGEEGEGREREGEEGGEEGEGREGQGRNADLKNKYIVDKLEEYEFLQLIKQIQLSNETSIKYILGIKTDDKTKLDSLIDEYKNNITEKEYQVKKPKKTETTWQSFNINNKNSNLYFNNSATLEKISSDPAEIQKVIYKCYDLQIVYLVKHIEVIEMFKLVYYYYDMMIKKIGILFFILSLYHKSDIDFTNVVIKLPLEKANVNEMIKKQTSLQQQTQSGGAITKEDIIDKLKTEIGEYKKTENSKYENKKTEYKTEAINNIKPLLDSTVPPPLKLFNHLLTYFKAFSDNQDNFKNYDYIDKLLIQLLKAILPEIAKTKNEDEYNKDEAKKIFNVVKTIYFDIIEQEINIHRKQDNVKKEKSSYGVVKIGQFSKMDYDISKTIAKNFETLFKYRIEDEIDYSKDSYENYTQYETLDRVTKLIVNARSLFKEQTPEKKTEAKEVIGTIENSMVDLFNSVEGEGEGEATITTSATGGGILVGGATGKLHYISDAIGKNKDFNDSDIPNIDTNENNDPQHIRTSLFEEYRLNFLDLLKNVYFPKDKKVDLKNMTIVKEIELLVYVLKRVRYKRQEGISNNNKTSVIYIKKTTFDVLNNQKDKLARLEAERLARLEAERRAQEEAERREAERRAREEAEVEVELTPTPNTHNAEEAANRLEAEEAANRLRLEAAEAANRLETEEAANRLKAEEAERRAQEERLRLEKEANRLKAEEAKRLEEERLAKILAEKESIFKKIQYVKTLYKKKGNEPINDDLRALSIKIENTEGKIYPDNGFTLLNDPVWWISRTSAYQITDEDTEICNQYYSSLLSILQGSALIYVNLKPKQDGGANQDMFKYDTKQLTFQNLCKDKTSTHGPYELIFPEENKKNEKLYQTLFKSNENESKTVGFTVGNTITPLEKQGLMTSIDNGKSVVLFGFGFSGSGKTYTLIEGGTGKSESESDTSILYQFIENNKNTIDSIEFLEIYPDPDKPTFFVGTGKEGELKDIIHLDKTNDQIKEDKKYNTIKINETNISIDIIKTSIAEIEKHRREQLRILPTPNNPNSSRSFLQITIKLKNNGDKKGGQLVIFDMPGTESTVRIKEMMLGKESYVDNTTLTGCIDFNEQNIQGCFKFNKAAKDYFLDTEIVNIKNQEPKTDLEIKNQEPKTINTFNIILCNILYQLLKYKSSPVKPGGSCSISNLFEGFDDTIKNNHIQTGNIYTLVTIKYTKQDDNSYTISSVQAKEKNQDNTKTIMNVLFKYFILNIFKFSHLDIKLPLETDKRSECDNYIATIGFELACFFNKKSYSTYNDYFKQTILDEIVFLKDDNYKKIYDQFLKIILISENFSINDSDISLSAEISSDQKKKMMEIFGFKVDTDTEIKFTLTNEVFTQTLDNIKQLDNFFLNNTKTTHTKSIFIKYILFILSYIKQKSETLKTDVLKQIHTSSGNFNKQNIILIKATPIKPTVINPTYTKPLLPSQMDNNNIKEYAYAKAIYDIENMRLRASVYFIYKYIKFIVNQGSGIMTTLEHLKFFFLSRAGKIEKYNKYVEQSKAFTIIDNKKDIFNKKEIYINTEGEGKIEEKINIGEMKKYGLISILQSLAGDETNLDTISKNKLKDTTIPNLLTPKEQTKAQPAEQTQNTTKSKFIMLAHINPFPNTTKNNTIIEADKDKKCNSAVDTLDYIDSISANNLDIKSGGANTGGSYRKKKYYKDIKASLSPTLKKNRLKRFTTLKKINKNKKNLFTSKTKKLL